ncbi:hypothetical protein BGZ97_002164 [Linnemannia gamsii]|jgi:hypothetical protein|uniref:Uncharacterized protein n=1 Tax=Linnemannia gamsii TaxID=64522 RepID=A0A9P6QWL2_9FUNG|nr:hypothetical protein BGZ97_002164 [Linnemannia gamsii]
MSSIFKSALLVSSVAALVLFQFASAAPQDLGLGLSGGYNDYGAGFDMGMYGGPGGPGGADSGNGNPTYVPVSPVTIIPETDFIPINNVQPVVNVLPVNVNDFSWPPYYNDYPYGGGGAYGGGAYGGGAYGGMYGGGIGGMMGGPF